MEELKSIGYPCRYMVYSSIGYHTCALLTDYSNTIQRFKKLHGAKIRECDSGVVCAWFFDINDDGIHTITPKSVVPKICPLGYTYEEIDAKIQPLMNKFVKEKNSKVSKHG